MESIDLSTARRDLSGSIKYRKETRLSKSLAAKWKLRLDSLIQLVSSRLIGQKAMLETLLIGILADGHVLLRGEPGIGKSTAIQSLAEVLGLETVKIRSSEDFIGANLVVIEEYQFLDPTLRANLMMAMQEGRFIFKNEEFYLDRPFVVLAAINPGKDEFETMTPAQLDRFLLFLDVPSNSLEEELAILKQHQSPRLRLEKQLCAADVLEIQRMIPGVIISDHLSRSLVQACIRLREKLPRQHALSSRAIIGYARACQARAFLNGRTEVTLEDLKSLFLRVVAHRTLAKADGTFPELIDETFRWLETQAPDSSKGL